VNSKLLMLVLSFFAASSSLRAQAAGVDRALVSRFSYIPSLPTFGPEVVFPLKAQMPFPWNSIEGTWLAQSGNFNAIYSFKIQSNAQHSRILTVLHLDPGSHRVLAQGIGLTGDDPRVVRAGMVSQGGTYWLMIRAFQDGRPGHANEVVTLLTIRPYDAASEDELHVVLKKVSDSPLNNTGISGSTSCLCN
jgi:hypothetical protein